MITISNQSQTDDVNKYDFEGLSTDTKPTLTEYPDMKNGSSFFELDTKTMFFWDASSENWV